MKKYIEKINKKYVIATLGNPTQYLHKTPAMVEYNFVEDIEYATKSNSKKVANTILDYFYKDTHLNNLDLVVVPITITYEILDETEQ